MTDARPRPQPPVSTAATTLRVTCWACSKEIKPDKAPRALCAECAYGGYFGGS